MRHSASMSAKQQYLQCVPYVPNHAQTVTLCSYWWIMQKKTTSIANALDYVFLALTHRYIHGSLTWNEGKAMIILTDLLLSNIYKKHNTHSTFQQWIRQWLFHYSLDGEYSCGLVKCSGNVSKRCWNENDKKWVNSSSKWCLWYIYTQICVM